MAEPVATAGSSPGRAATKAAQILIVGLGNPMMADDGIGHEVIRRLEGRGPAAGVRLLTIDGDVLALIDLWQGEPSVWLVDAVSGDKPAGTPQVYEHQDLLRMPAGGLSTHHPNLAESLRWILHTRPEMGGVKLRLYGIQVETVSFRPGLSRSVAVATDRLVRCLRAAITASRPPIGCGSQVPWPGVSRLTSS